MKNKSQKTTLHFYLLFIIFIFPVIAGSFLYFFHDQFHFKTTNHGILVTPPISIQPTEKKWQIIYVFNSSDKEHQNIDHALHQLQIALGKDHDRIKITTLNEKALELQTFKIHFQTRDKNFMIENKIYLVDPLGNLFMYYKSSTNLMGVLKDIKKVLEVSQIG